MAEITALLRQIKTARKGEDVRDSIHDAIEKCYTDGQQVNAIDLEARRLINDVIGQSTGRANETLLFPQTTDQIAPTYAGSPSADTGVTVYGDMQVTLNQDPSTFDTIRVYYQVVRQPNESNPYCSTPIVLEFSAEDFVNTVNVITGYNFGASNQHLRIRRMNIERNSDGFPSDPKEYIVKDSYYWAWDGSESSDAVTQPSDPTAMESNTYPVGAILKIVGVKYTDVTEAVEAVIAQTGGGGLTSELKAALDAFAQNVMYVNGNGSTYYNNLHNALYSSGGGGSDDPTPTPDPTVTVTSINAVYSQPGTVYDTDTLNSLKSNLVVTANYSDGTSGAVTGYSLSGNLTAGTSTITVTYSGKTTTFTVNVTAAQVDYIEGDGWTSGSPYTGLSLVENSYFTPSSNKIASYTNWSRTKYIDCDGASSISFPKLANNNANYCFFFANAAEDSATNAPLERFSLTSAQTKAVPSGAKYFMICGTSTDMATFIANDIIPTV